MYEVLMWLAMQFNDNEPLNQREYRMYAWEVSVNGLIIHPIPGQIHTIGMITGYRQF